MDPALLCLLALVGADPAYGNERNHPESPAATRPDNARNSPFGWSVARHESPEPEAQTTPVTDESDGVEAPFGTTGLILRGQSPTFAQPGVDPFQGQPGVYGGPGGVQALPAPITSHFYAVYENLFLTPFFSQNTATVTLGPGVAASVQQFDWDFEYSPRAEIGFISPDGGGWRARYWYFSHSTNDRAVEAAGTGVFISPDAVTGAGGAISPPVGGTAAAGHSLLMQVIDAEYIRKGVGGDPGLDISFGLRYARMDQWLRGRATNAAGMLTANNALHHSFEGIGPTIATEYRRPLWNSYWGVFGNARASVLYGDSNYRFDQRTAGALTANSTNNNDNGLQSAFEFQVGLDYRRPIFYCHEFLFRVGLETQYWANAGSASADLNGGAFDSAQDADLGFFGFTVATGLTW